MASHIVNSLGSLEEQRELFLFKFRDVDRTECYNLEKDFKKFDMDKRGELNEHQALQLMEFRATVKTARELRAMIADMDFDKNHRLSFIELCCAYFTKPYEELNNFVDEEARAAALEQAKLAADRVKIAEEEQRQAKENEERMALEKEAQIEAEKKLTGVAGKKAFFIRQAGNTVDVTTTNEQKIKEEAARRKVVREEKERLKKAMEEASKIKSAEEIIREAQEAAAEVKKAQEAAEAARVAEEKRIRQQKIAEKNAMWAKKGTA